MEGVIMIGVILTYGFEEIEAVAIIDVLRRADLSVTVLGMDGMQETGSHGITVNCDEMLLEPEAYDDYQAIILPGGEPGTTNLEKSPEVRELLTRFNKSGKLIGAICAAPRILDGLNILNDKKATNYPTQKNRMENCKYVEDRVVKDGSIITSRGPGCAIEFALKVVEAICGSEKSQELKKNMLVAK
jgi:4-methyl-5(b-hydroxyethyl)-thiazole monophosphate biosynthesis